MVNMSKRVIKSLIKKAYKIRINYLIKPSIKSLMNENYEAAAENDKKVIAYISTLSKGGKLNRIKKKTVAKSIIEYVKALNLVALYQKDSMINNQSVKLYSECVLNGVLDQKIFMPYDWCEFVNALLIANARICATETYRKLYNEFVNQYSDVRKARAISQLLMCNTGYILYKTQVIPLIERFDVTMGKLESRYNAKQNNKNLGLITEYMRNMLFISDMCFVSIDGIEKYAKKYMHIFTCNNVISYKILRLLKQLLTKDRCVCEIEIYLRTIKNNEHEKIDKYTKAANELEAILVEIETDEIQKISYSNEMQSVYAELVQCTEEGESDKKAIFDKIIATEKAYELKINKSSVLDDDVAKNLEILFNVRYIRRKQQYLVQFDEMMQKVASVGTSDIIYFFPSDEYIAFAPNILPVLIEAQKRKYLVYPSNTLTFHFNSDDQELNDIARLIYYNKISGVVESKRFRKGCKIDIPNRLIEYDGMNIYQPIYEVVSQWNFSLFMHFADNAFSRAYVYRNIIIFQNIFSQCEELYSYAVENRKKVKIVHATPHVNVGVAYFL